MVHFLVKIIYSADSILELVLNSKQLRILETKIKPGQIETEPISEFKYFQLELIFRDDPRVRELLIAINRYQFTCTHLEDGVICGQAAPEATRLCKLHHGQFSMSPEEFKVVLEASWNSVNS